MKRILWIGLCLVAMMLCVAAANAATVTLEWNHPGFPEGSDPAQSGFHVFKSTDDGQSKTLIPNGTTDMDTKTLTYTEMTPGSYAYYVTAFNQVGESAFSDPATASIAVEKPEKPTGLRAILAQVIAWLKRFFG